MDAPWLAQILAWVETHPLLALAGLSAAVAVEGLFLVGMVIPGSVLMFAAGAMIASGHLPLWPTLIASAAGAAVGDFCSYILGRRYRDQLFELSARLRAPRMMERGEQFFVQHGGKSVVLGRFIGPLRPLVPAIAGAAGMPLASFVAIDIVAALLWAPAYALPGLVVGATIAVAAEVATRLALVIGIVVGGAWLLWWCTRSLVWLFQNKAERWIARTMDWSHRHRRLGHLGPALADPDQPETPILAACALALFVVGWIVGALIWGLGENAAVPVIDEFVYDWLAGLQTPGVLAVASTLSALASVECCLALSFSVLIVLGASRRPRTAAHWAAASLSGALLGLALPGRRAMLVPGAATDDAAGMLLLMILCFTLAGLVATRHHPRLRIGLYSAVGTLAGLGILAKLLLGTATVTQLSLALALALSWSSLLLLGYRRHLRGTGRLPAGLTLVVAALSLSLPTAANWSRDRDTALALSPDRPIEINAAIWQHLRAAPQPQRVNLLWVGDRPRIAAQLGELGWLAVPALTREAALGWFRAPSGSELDLPPLPQALSGNLPDLELERRRMGQREVLRLWRAEISVAGHGEVWRGTVANLVPRDWFGLLTIPVTQTDTGRLRVLAAELSDHWRAELAAGRNGLLIVEPR